MLHNFGQTPYMIVFPTDRWSCCNILWSNEGETVHCIDMIPHNDVGSDLRRGESHELE